MGLVTLGAVGVAVVGGVFSSAATGDGGDAALFAEDISSAVSPLVENEDAVGIVVGVVVGDGSSVVVPVGAVSLEEDAAAVDGGTVFEIGSVTKVLTALAVVDAVERGELELSDTVSDLWPEGAGAVPEGAIAEATVEELLRHTSGLPTLPKNLGPAGFGSQPYAGYTVEDLWEGLRVTPTVWEPGERHGYSNLGSAAAGELAAAAAGVEYHELVMERVMGALGVDAGFGIAMAGGASVDGVDAVPHNVMFAPVEAWEFRAMAPAGAGRASGDAMVAFVEACLDALDGEGEGTVHRAVRATVNAEPFALDAERAGAATEAVLLGWMRSGAWMRAGDSPTPEVVWHNGRTAGSRAFVGLVPELGIGVVVLANSVATEVESIGVRVLRAVAYGEELSFPTRGFERLSEEELAKYVGRYRLRGAGVLDVKAERGRLVARLPGQPAVPVYYSGEGERFFYKAVEAELVFAIGEVSGDVIGVTLEQNGMEFRGMKL